MNGLESGAMSGFRCIRSVSDEPEFARVFYHAQPGNQRPGIRPGCVIRKRVRTAQPFSWPSGGRSLACIGIDERPWLWKDLREFVVYFIERLHTVKAGDAGRIGILRS